MLIYSANLVKAYHISIYIKLQSRKGLRDTAIHFRLLLGEIILQ